LVKNALELLDRELRRKRVRPSRVHLSLSTDPFMFGYPQITEVSLALIERLNEAGIPCSVLTKGLLPDTLADTHRFHPSNIYGISLVSLSEDFRRRFEPGAVPYALRIEALKALHVRGARTRVHMEPYPTPNLQQQDLAALLCEVSFTDSIFFGGLNYNPCVDAYPNAKGFYNACRQQVRQFCSEQQIECEN
jgi:DNA repair photolyase